jgi:hypothetical protein
MVQGATLDSRCRIGSITRLGNYSMVLCESPGASALAPQKRQDRLIHLRCHIAEFSLLELCLPEDGIHICESMLDPAILLDVV